ncbi:MAG: esterase family protein [Clostridia bacterium]|nr:esterase family protein [Clostridia bacterium]
MKRKHLCLIALLLAACLALNACSKGSRSDSAAQTQAQSRTERKGPYASENRYDIEESYFQKHKGTDYGTLIKNISYDSTVAAAEKQCNVLLPAGYDETRTYPVMYVIHGFWGSHKTLINDDTFLTLLYGNMLKEGLCVPMILVGIDMYTDDAAGKQSKTDAQKRNSYNKVVKEIHTDLMPFIEKSYPVSKERRHTAVAGYSEGGAKALCIGFNWLDEFGYIGSFAPSSGVIPTDIHSGSFWSIPYMEAFPEPTADNTPYYLYMAVGDKDPYCLDSTLYYRDVLNDLHIKNQTDLVEGFEHDNVFWGQCFYNFLTKAFQ